MRNLILKAAVFARAAHAGQIRKYTGVEYISHPGRVAGRVAVHPEATEEMVAAALLHDTLEDTGTTVADLVALCGDRVANLVIDLTDPTSAGYETTSRAERKAIMRASIAAGSREAQIIKLFDRIDNLHEMPLTPPNSYIRMYLEESRLLAEAIGSADLTRKSELLALCT